MAGMMVIDTERSEIGRQRRKDTTGRFLHACCICGNVSTWSDGWSAYCSEADIDESAPIPKFCSVACRKKGGPRASLVTEEMKLAAKQAEWREPKAVYRQANDREKFRSAVDQQRRSRP